jgi:hypothetical protein
MAHSLLSGFIYLAIAAIVLSSVFLTIVHAGSQACVNGTVIYTGVGACNGTSGFGAMANNPEWSASELALYGVIGLAGIIALLMGALQLGGVL